MDYLTKMSIAVENTEISVLSLLMAKSLVYQTVANINDDTNDTTNTDTVNQNLELSSSPSLKAPPIKITSAVFRQSSKEFLESCSEAGLLNIQISTPCPGNLDIQDSIQDTYGDDFVPTEYQLDEDAMTATQPDNREESISKIFERKDGASETSMFPFSMLGENPEVKKFEKWKD